MVDLKKNWSFILNTSIKKKFGRRLSYAEFSTQYNLKFNRSITSETARRWMIGLTIPNIMVVNDILHWLDFDPNDIFYSSSDGMK